MSVTVEQAYGQVERLTRERARNFSYGIRLLPKPKRRAIAAIYAFAREVDDIADDPALPPAERRVRLEALRASLAGEPGDALNALIDGGLQDTEQVRYADFDELRGYCSRVAGAVGVACMAVYGADQPQRAEAMGIALQLINIMRDVDEDWSLGRVYIPQDELASYGVSEADIAAGRCTPAWQALMAYQAARARSYLAEGRTLLPYLDRRSAGCVAAFANLYEATLERIVQAGFDVFGGPPSLSSWTKVRIVGTGLVLK
jgi:phytoene synthase